MGIAWEPSNNAMLLRISGSSGQKSTSSLFNKFTYSGKSSLSINHSEHISALCGHNAEACFPSSKEDIGVMIPETV